MTKIFDKKQVVKIDLPEGSKIVSQKLSDKARQELEKNNIVLNFPYSQFEKYLRGNKDVLKLEANLKHIFFAKLPHETICKDCIKHTNSKFETSEANCAKAWLEYQMLYFLAGNNLVAIIEVNRKVLRKEVKQKLVELFYTIAFEFDNANSFFRVGEMVKFLLKEGLKEISNQLKQMEFNTARTIASQNYHAVKEKMILAKLGEPGFKDFLKNEKEFWKNKNQELDAKQRISLSETTLNYSNLGKAIDKPLSGNEIPQTSKTGKPTKTTFKSTLSDTQLRKLLNNLKGEFIDTKTSYSQFKVVFSEVDISTVQNKINWQAANNLLAYFIDAMIRENHINEGNHWYIANHCFTNSENLANASLKYRETNKGQPKKADIINEIVKGL